MRACAEQWRSQGGVTVRWEARSLEAFGDQPLEDIAGEYDLIVIDHPFCGRAARTGCLTPLDALLDDATLATLSAGAIGPSHDSYTYVGRQWGLATDAACQVAAVRDDLIAGGATPRSWDEALDLARRMPGMVALPLTPPHAVSSWLSIVGAHGREPFVSEEVDARATALLAELARLGPEEGLGWEPPDALARMTTTDDVAYIPLTYGYSTYATSTPRPCRFTDAPAAADGPQRAVLGGAGLAVSAASAQPAEAAAFAAWASSTQARSIEARVPE